MTIKHVEEAAERWAGEVTVTLSGTTYSEGTWHQTTGSILRNAFARAMAEARLHALADARSIALDNARSLTGTGQGMAADIADEIHALALGMKR